MLSSIIQAYLESENMVKSNLPVEAKKALAITSHIKSQLRSMSDFANNQELNHWYITSTALMKTVIQEKFYSSINKPEFYGGGKYYKTNCLRIIKDLESKIRNFPSDVTIKEIAVVKQIEARVEILPSEITNNTRGYISKLAKQINSTFENQNYDATSILMRRLFEIMLILVYRKNGKEDLIRGENNNYKNLKAIMNIAKIENQFGFSQTLIKTMDQFRKLGNNAAHRIEYNCVKSEIDQIKTEFRVSIEEMLYKSGVRT